MSVKCRCCGIRFEKDDPNVEWVMPTRNMYYHKECYETWKQKGTITTKADEDHWKSYIYDYLGRDLKIPYNYHKCEKQLQKYIKENKYTAKGIFFALKYFYEYKNGRPEDANGGVGIVPYIYEDAKNFWISQTLAKNSILEDIEKQYEERKNRETLTIRKNKKQKKYKGNLDKIGEMIDE